MKYLIDTHILIWWYEGNTNLPSKYKKILVENEKKKSPISIASITLWEIAKLHELNKLKLTFSLDVWFQKIKNHSGILLNQLTPEIALESTRLKNFHQDPADQIIVATSRINNLALLTVDKKIIHSEATTIA